MSEDTGHMVKMPDVVTIINAVLGFAAILLAMRGEMTHAAGLILVAAGADGLDGALARRIGHSVIGLNLDSLADAVSFGVAPAVMGYSLMSGENLYIAFILPAAYMTCGILRLARFNISKKRDEFVGLPITAAGACTALLVLADADFLALIGAYMILSVLMIGTVSYPKIRSFKILIAVGIVIIIDITSCYIMGLGLFYFTWSLLIMMAGYIISPLAMEVYHVLR
jgi:CDP-diacylglycerol--serine O-phosphatidyltransferase